MIIFIFLTTLLWSLTIPIWHFPDEQAHFAQVQDYVEIGHVPYTVNDLSQEIYESEKILGTLRDHYGINKYTYRSSFNIPYSNLTIGIEEIYLRNLPKSYRTNLVKGEAARYPPMYYWLTSIGYRFVYNQSLFARVLATRFVSGAMGVFTAIGTYLIATIIFPKNSILQKSTLFAVGLQPMLMFVNAGVNNDVLNNLLSTFVIYFSALLIFTPFKAKNLILVIGVMILGVFTKPLIFLFTPIVFLSIGIALYRGKFHTMKILIGVSVLILIFIASIIVLQRFKIGLWLPYWPSMMETGQSNFTPIIELLTQKLSQLYRETFVWYWGVYRWLSLALPIPLLRLIKVLIILSIIGYIKLRDKEIIKKLLFLLLVNIIYVGLILAWDLSQIRTFGFSHGIQGRYFFPLISTHMLFLIYGWYLLLPKKLKNLILPITLILFLSLNYYSLYHVLSSYYQNLNQLSQYKPLLAKWPYIGVYIGGYLLFILFYVYKKLKKTNRWHLRLWRSR